MSNDNDDETELTTELRLLNDRCVKVELIEGRGNTPGHTPNHRCMPSVVLNNHQDSHNVFYFHVPASLRFTFRTSSNNENLSVHRIRVFSADLNGHTKTHVLCGHDSTDDQGNEIVSRVPLLEFQLAQETGFQSFDIPHDKINTYKAYTLEVKDCYPAYGEDFTYLYQVCFDGVLQVAEENDADTTPALPVAQSTANNDPDVQSSWYLATAQADESTYDREHNQVQYSLHLETIPYHPIEYLARTATSNHGNHKFWVSLKQVPEADLVKITSMFDLGRYFYRIVCSERLCQVEGTAFVYGQTWEFEEEHALFRRQDVVDGNLGQLLNDCIVLDKVTGAPRLKSETHVGPAHLKTYPQPEHWKRPSKELFSCPPLGEPEKDNQGGWYYAQARPYYHENRDGLFYLTLKALEPDQDPFSFFQSETDRDGYLKENSAWKLCAPDSALLTESAPVTLDELGRMMNEKVTGGTRVAGKSIVCRNRDQDEDCYDVLFFQTQEIGNVGPFWNQWIVRNEETRTPQLRCIYVDAPEIQETYQDEDDVPPNKKAKSSTMDGEELESTRDGNCCCICLRSLDPTQDALATFPCQHQVHLICAMTSLVASTNSNCPLCRAPMQRRALGIELSRSSAARSSNNPNLANILSQWTFPTFGDTDTLHGNPFRLISRHHGFILTETSDDYRIVQRRPNQVNNSSSSAAASEESSVYGEGQLWQAVGDRLLRSVSSGRFLSLSEGQRAQNQTLLVTTEEPTCQFEVQGSRLIHVESDLCVEVGAGDAGDMQPLWLWSQDGDPWQHWECPEHA